MEAIIRLHAATTIWHKQHGGVQFPVPGAVRAQGDNIMAVSRRPGVVVVVVGLLLLLPCWSPAHGGDTTRGARPFFNRKTFNSGQASLLRGNRRAFRDDCHSKRIESPTGIQADVSDELFNIPLVEFTVVQADAQRFHRALFFPLDEKVYVWWAQLKEMVRIPKLRRSLMAKSRIHVEILGETPLQVGSIRYRGALAVLTIPNEAIASECRVGTRRVDMVASPFAQLMGDGQPVLALVLDCPTRGGVHMEGNGAMLPAPARHMLHGPSRFRWLLWPWFVIFLPFFWGYTMGPIALLAGACVTLASLTLFSCVLAILVITAYMRCVLWIRKRRRFWHLRTMLHRSSPVELPLDRQTTCCICLEAPVPRDTIIALLPCMHSLHADCYNSWIRADSYYRYDLICPICRGHIEAIGKVAARRLQ
eukprot:TRINITY_DN61035_c0_g1_i1.p1 TRINITY_DN61035_c0_g1~~TRINITY_DN61035_c0_g1_i1.p1  ORF type:complete len:420 (-),score=38.78 TRINITY_DN61035_c0_g1_i1:46-1305(-)